MKKPLVLCRVLDRILVHWSFRTGVSSSGSYICWEFGASALPGLPDG